ncbi:sugar phosphate isomerase/epimerase [Bacillus sp. AFS055030]|uniref:sugar phosphate isomerase/epimerase family protein n=1 Tax=Bacillus sp. AFS055030 TaxID=2033507 RepID=UPI000BFC871F|nr:sugar phosphate isomerase/epimerase [Bacillus sp. AFS055030]PGL70114.1 sugar phosphate isomerase [Bacillus sp. AFS055030]
MTLPIALQLWSVKEDVEIDFFGTLEKVAKMGYDGVELAGYYGKTALEIKTALNKLGLKVAGSHISAEQIIHHIDDVIAFEKELGNKYVVCPWANFTSLEEWKEFAEHLQQSGKKLAKEGISLVYHNHAHELVTFENECILDILLNSVPTNLLKAELDTYWLEFAGVDPVEFMSKYKGRTPLIHVKDMAPSKEESTEVGNGIMNIRGIVQQAKLNSAEWLIIEQEAFTKPQLESVEIGLNNLKMILAKA